MRYIVILNEDAGNAGRATPGATPAELRAAFAEAGVTAEIRLVGPGQLEDVVKKSVAARPDAIVIGGGDGSVRCAAQVLAGTGIPLGVLPLGTFNHFAKDLKLPADPEEVVDILAAGVTREVDLGEVNGHVFINNCSLGAYAEAVRRRDDLQQRRVIGKWWAMWRASFEEFRRLRRLRLRIKTCHDLCRSHPELNEARGITGPVAVRTPVVVVGNNRYSGHLLSQNLRPRLDEGRLWLYTVRARRHLAVLRMMAQSLFRRLDEADALAAEAAAEITIESDCGPVPIAADGEILETSAPFHFRIRPRALRVLVAGTSEEERKTVDGGRWTENREWKTGKKRHKPEPALTPRG